MKDKQGYVKVNLYKNKKVKYTYIHRLVAEHFIPNPENKPLVLHKIPICNGGGNSVDNLYWGYHKENAIDKIKDGNFYSHLHKRKINYRPVNQYDLKGNFIKQWDNIREMARELNIDRRSVYRNLSNETKQYAGYIFKYSNTY